MKAAIYNFALRLFDSGLKLHAVFNAKSARRNQLLGKIRPPVSSDKHSKSIWFHCASLGEYQMIIPLIEMFRKFYPNAYIAVSFFSVSGYLNKVENASVDWFGMLPTDLPVNAGNWVGSLKPDIAVFVKYEFWWNYLKCLNKRGCAVFLIAARLPVVPKGIFYDIYLSKIFPLYRYIFSANNHTSAILSSKGYAASYAGDPRADSLLLLNAQKNAIKKKKESPDKVHAKTMVWGSIWPKDFNLVLAMAGDQDFATWKHLIIPHEINEPLMLAYRKKLMEYGEVSLHSDHGNPQRLHLVDSVGQLRLLYKEASICYVGGGFGEGVHNVMEAAYWGKPVLFGPKFEKDPAALDWVNHNICQPVRNYGDLKISIIKLESKPVYLETAEKMRWYFDQSLGSTLRIFEKIQLLTSDEGSSSSG